MATVFTHSGLTWRVIGTSGGRKHPTGVTTDTGD